MNLFLIKLFKFLLPIIILAIVMEMIVRSIPNVYSFKKDYLDKNAGKIENLILGSSHSFAGCNPEYFYSNSFNASNSGQTLDYDLKIFNFYKKELIRLKTILIPISYFSLFMKLEDSKEPWREKNYILYFGFNGENSFLFNFEITSNRVSVLVNRLIDVYILNKRAIDCNNLGWSTSYSSQNSQDLSVSGKVAAKRHTLQMDSDKIQSNYNEILSSLKLLIEWSQNRNIKIIFFTPPAFESYRENIDAKQLRITVDTITKLCEEYKNCKYINLLGDTNYFASDYYNADHLSEIGAKKLSNYLNCKIYDR